jgi:hypothetical protein
MLYITYDYETYRKPIEDSDRDEFVPLVLGYAISDGKDIQERSCYTGDNCSNEFCELIRKYFDKEKEKTDVYIISYNGIGFDNCFLLKTLYAHFRKEVNFSNTLSSSNTIKKIMFANIAIVDFSRLYAGGLDNICRDFKVKGKQAPVLVKIKEEGVVLQKYLDDPAYRHELESYCIQDCVCLMECYLKHRQVILQEGFPEPLTHKFTSAGLAKAVFPYFLKKNYTLSSIPKTEEFERKSYKGGFTAVFKYSNKSGKNLFYYDINSMYPWAMKESIMPYEWIATTDVNLTEHNALEEQNLYLLDRIEYPTLNNFGKKTIPNIYTGKPKLLSAEEDWRSGAEIQLAKNLGAKYHIKKEVIYTGKKDIFKYYVDYFYKKKSEAKKDDNKARELFYKLMLNCLYGKMGQRDYEKSCIVKSGTLIHGIENMGGKISEVKHIFSDQHQDYYFLKSSQIDYTNYENNIGRLVRFARQTTAVARTRLFDMMNRIGLDDMYYCDTDSVITSIDISKVMPEWVSNSELGLFKDELGGNYITYFRAFAPKCYTYKTNKDKEERKAKGIMKEKIKTIDYELLAGAELGEAKQEIENQVFKRGLDQFQYYENTKALVRDPFPKFQIVDEETTEFWYQQSGSC